MSDGEFANEFRKLKEVYETYSKNKIKIQTTTTGKMMIKRSVPMALPGLLMTVLSTTGLGVNAAIIGGILSAVAITAGAIWGANEQSKMPQKIAELDEQFKVDYSCPSCHKPFGQQNSWESLRRQGKCPYCGRKFGN